MYVYGTNVSARVVCTSTAAEKPFVFRARLSHRLRMSTTAMPPTDLASRIQRLEDIEAIRRLKARYFNACDRQDPETASHCFADAEVLIDMGHIGVFKRREEFAALYRAAGCHEYILDAHHGANAEIDIIGPDQARGTWALGFRNINTRDRTVTFLSVLYHDEYARIAGEWLITRSRVEYKTALHLSYASGTLQALLASQSVAGAVSYSAE